MQQRKIPLTELVPLYRKMTDRQWSENRLCGALYVEDQGTADFLTELLSEENADHYPCLVDEGDEENIRPGDRLQLRFGRVRTGIGLLVSDLASLLLCPGIASGTNQLDWYLVDKDEASWEGKEISRRLNCVHQFVKALEGSASIFDTRNNRLVFLRDGKFEVPLQFDADALMSFDLEVAEDIVNQLSIKDGHTDQRHEICATAICEMLAGVPKSSRLSVLLLELTDFKQRFLDGYKLFASSFSFEKIRDQAEAIKLEYLGKIHKTFTDIQSQLLGIPISTVVVATQFKNVDDLIGAARVGQMWINVAVIVGAFIFCIFLTLSALNQKHTIDALDEDIKRHKKLLESEYSDIKDRLSPIFETLSSRACFHRFGLCVVIIVCWGAFLFGLSVFWMLTKNAL